MILQFENFVNLSDAAQKMVDNPDPRWREGRGIVGTDGELAALIHAAEKGYPPKTKHLMIHKGNPETAFNSPSNILNHLWQIAVPLVEAGIIDIKPSRDRYYLLGKPDAVEKGYELHNITDSLGKETKDIQLAYHRELGHMLGYTQNAIDEFVKEINNKLNKEDGV